MNKKVIYQFLVTLLVFTNGAHATCLEPELSETLVAAMKAQSPIVDQSVFDAVSADMDVFMESYGSYKTCLYGQHESAVNQIGASSEEAEEALQNIGEAHERESETVDQFNQIIESVQFVTEVEIE